MDPSMLLGFLCQNSQDFDNLCDQIDRVNIKKNCIMNLMLQLSFILMSFFLRS
jgi:hypothetical protein